MSADEHATLEQLDADIERLQREREALTALINNPEERERRRLARDLAVGRYFSQVGFLESSLPELIQANPAEAWLWTPEWLEADGWTTEKVRDRVLWRDSSQS